MGDSYHVSSKTSRFSIGLAFFFRGWLPLALASSLRLLSLALFLFDLLRRLDLLPVEPGRPVDWEHGRGFS